MEIIRGKIKSAKKIVIYGPEGIGKTTFASKFPDPLFIDTEGGTKEFDVARTQKPQSWAMLMAQIDEVKKDPSICRTLVIDTVDWAEQMCIESICQKHHKDGLESFSYGNGYVYVKEEFGRFLNKLTEVVEKGIHVVLAAHAQLRKFEQPDELGAYDRWELKLGKKTTSQISPLVKEWSDMLLFANYKTFAVAVDDQGKKHKAQGGKRVMYTAHHPCWDAKNRYGLPEEMPFDYTGIAEIIEGESAQAPAETAEKEQKSTLTAEKEQKAERNAQRTERKTRKQDPDAQASTGKEKQISLKDLEKENAGKEAAAVPQETGPGTGLDARIPPKLRELMEAGNISDWDLENIMETKGYVPAGTRIWDYDTVNPGIVDGLLVACWDQVVKQIRDMKDKQVEEIPF